MSNENVQWINERFRSNLTEGDLSSVSDFLLFWSLFEKIACNRQANIGSLFEFAQNNEHRFNRELVNDTMTYFKDRYFENGTVTERFQYLRIQRQELSDFVVNTFQNETPLFLDILKTCLIIVYRFRNNLFHGEKNILKINTQDDNFKNSNNFLKHLLECQ
ncbi:MAG: hypothetical protein ACPKPY_05955 [Nitrososphaeraceae archaeon]